MFVLEKQEYLENSEMYRHCGYLDMLFLTREEAAKYYNDLHPDMQIDAVNGWKTERSLKNKIRVAVREYYNEKRILKSLDS